MDSAPIGSPSRAHRMRLQPTPVETAPIALPVSQPVRTEPTAFEAETSLATDEAVHQFIRHLEDARNSAPAAKLIARDCPNHLTQSQFFEIAFPTKLGQPARWDELRILGSKVAPEYRGVPLSPGNFAALRSKFQIMAAKDPTAAPALNLAYLDLTLSPAQAKDLVSLYKASLPRRKPAHDDFLTKAILALVP